MEFSVTCGLCKKNKGTIRNFTLRKKPYKVVKMQKVLCDSCMAVQNEETVEQYLSKYYGMEVRNEG